MRSRLPFPVLAAFAIVIASPAISHAQSFQGLGSLPGSSPTGSGSSFASAVSADGLVVAGVSGTQAFRRTVSTGMVGLGVVPGASSQPAGVNVDGSVIVGTNSFGAFPSQAFRWTAANGIVNLGSLPGYLVNGASGVNADGSVVVGTSNAADTSGQAFRWTASSGMVGLGYLSGNNGNAWSTGRGVNADGSVVVGGSIGQAFRWTPTSGMTGLGFLPGSNVEIGSEAFAVSADGSVVVGQSGGEAFRWTAATGMIDLGFSSAYVCFQPFGVNADGSVIVGGSGGPASRAIRWTAEGWIAHLPVLPSLQVTPATNIAASGNPGGPFFPSSFNYSVSSISGNVDFSISGVPSWLIASMTSGTATASPATVTFSVNANGNSLQPGTYNATINFTNTTNGQGNRTRTATLTIAAGATSIVAAVAPNARTTTLGNVVTGFATIINTGTVLATACALALPDGVPATFLYQTTDPATNLPIGTPNVPVTIAAGQAQTFYFAIMPSAIFSQDIALLFQCSNTPNPAPSIAGLDTFLLTVNSTPIPDMLSIAETFTHDGNLVINGANGIGMMAVASIDIGAAGTVVFMPTDTPVGQLPRNLPLSLFICQTDSSGTCINPTTPGASSMVTAANNQTVFFSVVAVGQGVKVPYDPGNNRIFILAKQSGTPVGEASAAVKMQ